MGPARQMLKTKGHKGQTGLRNTVMFRPTVTPVLEQI